MKNLVSIHVDLDGTLVNTAQATILAYQDAVLHFGGVFTDFARIQIAGGDEFNNFLPNCFL